MDIFKPVNYELIFEPDLKRFTFNCDERIKFEIKKPTNKIVLNAVDLKVERCFLSYKNMEILPRKFELNEETQELVITLGQKISGKAELFFVFSGTINDKLAGFYRSQYLVKGKKKFLATTQFEPADARRAFVCWDEPEAKATFDVSVSFDKNLTAISNMPIAKQKNIKGKKIVTFARTPVMSTYLLYLGLGEFESIQDKLGKTLIRVVTTPGKRNQGKLALEFAKKFLKFYEDYFEIRYPLPKLDLIALPDFPEGAMENWGAITFRETELLYDPKVSEFHTKQAIAEVIAHEFVHQWFGDLVTMKWWNDLWLNESFATFMAYKSVNQFYPEFDMWSFFLDYWTSSAMNLDALKTSHPIEVRVQTPAELGEIFDSISYGKGASILRMLENFLGSESFRKGLNKYLESHKYSNATTDDLWSTLAAVSKKPVKKIMDSWVKQTGYPVIEATIENERLKILQKRFLLENRTESTKWFIPISAKNNGGISSFLLSEKSEVLQQAFSELNANQIGFYRVKYSNEILDKLKHLVLSKKIGNIERFGIQNDLFQLCIAGEIHPDEYLEFLRNYIHEDDYLVLSDIADNLSFLYFITFGTEHNKKIVFFSKIFFRRLFERYGWEPKEGEKFTDSILRSDAINALGKLGDEKILKSAKEKFQAFLKNPDSLIPDLRTVVYKLVAWQGNEETFKQLASLYKKNENQEEKIRFLIALSAFKDAEILKQALKFSLSKDVRTQDLYIPVAVVSGNVYGRHLVFPWIKENWKTLTKLYAGGSMSRLRRIVESMNGLSDLQNEKEIKQFFKKQPKVGIDMALAQTLERIRISAKFLERLQHDGKN